MDTFLSTRIAMSGWIFLAVLISSLWRSHTQEWITLIDLIKNGNGTIALAVSGAIVGIGAPPALGFLFERIISVLLTFFGRGMWLYPCVKTFKDNLAGAIKNQSSFKYPDSDSGLFYIFFYTYADQKVLDWTRRRRTHMYASFTSSLSIISALTVVVMLNAFSWSIGIISLIVASLLFYHGIREGRYHREAFAAWADTLGKKVVQDFVDASTSNKAAMAAQH